MGFQSAFSVAFALVALSTAVPVLDFARHSQNSIGCRNEHNEPVDWFIVYKLPEMPTSTEAMEKEGVAHMYMDESTNGQWRQSTVSIQTDKHAVAYTLEQLYGKQSKDAFHLMYNDETPEGKTSSSKGHAKGVTMFDQTSGFWLLHSVPKFPTADVYSYPNGGRKFGQMLFCVSFPYERLGEIGDQLHLYEPYIYSSALPSEISKKYKILQSVINAEKPTETAKHEITLRSSGGVTFTSFAKDGKWGEELYTNFVAPSLKQSLFVETWQNGQGDLPSSCKGAYHVNNIKEVQVSKSVDFMNSKDHSKWAVSVGKSSDWICIGGINRQHGQISRGGGTMCMQNKNVWETFSVSVKNTQPCSKDKSVM